MNHMPQNPRNNIFRVDMSIRPRSRMKRSTPLCHQHRRRRALVGHVQSPEPIAYDTA
jgi:hypothetical protein